MVKQDATVDKPSQNRKRRGGEDRAAPVVQRRTRMERDASGRNADSRVPIDPRMPHLPPA